MNPNINTHPPTLTQGQEREVIILSTTATRPGSSAAFVSDAQRLNVALTRARRHLVVVGAAGVMQGAANAFAHILQHCRYVVGVFKWMWNRCVCVVLNT